MTIEMCTPLPYNDKLVYCMMSCTEDGKTDRKIWTHAETIDVSDIRKFYNKVIW